VALAQPGVLGFHWLLNDTLTDLSFGSSLRHWGANTLPMQVGTNTLHLGPNSFFQNNVHLLLPLLDAVAEQVGPAEHAVDLYGGVGTIAMHLAPQVGSVISIESQAESAALARYNSSVNNLGNVKVKAEEVWSFLSRQMPGSIDVFVADPPRTGLGPEVCAEILRLAPRRVVYVSCNPLSQLDDLRILAPAYELTMLRGYDMFPHTPHVETLSVLDRR
jgi:tRNA/tmRNA/rRNA uracil-C5-methylase (TrmA/RlmC/RlmD family)